MKKKKAVDQRLNILTPQGLEQGDTPQKMQLQKRTHCIRCGKCCMGSSPSLMKEDMALFTSGILSYDAVSTIRDGELVPSREDGQIYESFTELIKLKEGEKAGCLFYKGEEGCSIYEHRPAQCRTYECWTKKNLYDGLEEGSLKRADLFRSVDVLIDAIRRHEEKCSYKRLSGAFERLAEGDEAAVEEIMDALQFDTYLRPFLEEKFNVPAPAMSLVLGKPLLETINAFGFKVVKEGDDYILSAIEEDKEQQ